MSQPNTLSLLKSAASQIADEEKEDGLGGLLIAADQIAQEHGLSSPLRGKGSEKFDFDLSYSKDEQSMSSLQMNNISSLAGKLDESDRADTTLHRDTDAFLSSMKSKVEPKIEPKVEPPKLSASVNFKQPEEDDVDALLNLAQKQGIKIIEPTKISPRISTSPEPSPRASPRPLTDRSQRSNRSSYSTKKYLENISKFNSGLHPSMHSSATTLRSSSAISTPSKIALMLNSIRGESKDRIRSSFNTGFEEQLFRSMQVVTPLSARSLDSRADSRKKNRPSRDAIRESSERLSTPFHHGPSKEDIRNDPTLKFLTFDDAKETTFTPMLKRKSKKGDPDDRPQDNKYSFIARQEAEERSRRQDQLFQIGRLDYDAKIDKKTCPNCGNKQSYEEVKDKRKSCPQCHVEYINTKSWNKVKNRFFKKCREYAQTLIQHRTELIQEIEQEYKFITRKKLDVKTGKITVEQIPRSTKLTKQEEEEFFKRLQEKHLEQEMKLKQLDNTLKQEYCPFQPKINEHSKEIMGKTKHDELNEEDLDDLPPIEDEKDPVKAFLRRYERDMIRRRELMPQKYLQIMKTRHRSRSRRGRKNDHSDGESGEDDEEEEIEEESNQKTRSEAKGYFRF